MSDYVVPDFTEEAVGWRGWQITDDGKLAAIVSENTIWQPGEALAAVCGKGKRHPVPLMNCTCGFYATKTLELLVENGYHMSGVIGRVSIWGKMINYSDGYRTQFAYPRELWIPYTLLHLIPPLSRYGVPVRLCNPYELNERKLLDGNR